MNGSAMMRADEGERAAERAHAESAQG